MAGYKPNSSDYAEYELIRNTFLREPRGRAALLMGGIVWRLAIEVLGTAPATDGPSFHPQGLEAQSSYSGIIVDDKLSEDEVNLICGVYKIYTSSMYHFCLHSFTQYSCTENSKNQQTSDSSWWPKPIIFEKSGLYIGYWTTACEAWFQNRLQKIRAGCESVKNGQEWRAGPIKFQKATPLLVQANDQDSQKFLHTYSFPL